MTRIVAAVVATICLVGAFFFGLVILAVIAVFIAGLSLVFWLRAWWLRRNSPSPMAQPDTHQAGHQRGGQGQEIIEGEYTVISERRD
ncbi:MAG: hypothetical protein SH820_18180 [Xanthomonadales bacterium]|nr:hypothetical protein [Xanthomonadales bacterium]